MNHKSLYSKYILVILRTTIFILKDTFISYEMFAAVLQFKIRSGIMKKIIFEIDMQTNRLINR